jgi:glycerol-3-phosphate O-acyltransferase
MRLSEERVESYWPVDESRHIIYVLDAYHEVEEELLQRCIREKCGTGAYDHVPVPITRVQEDPNVSELSRLLLSNTDSLVVPVRVVWHQPDETQQRAPKFKDLILGDSRRPGKLRASMMLKRDANRAECIAGEPATVEQLQQRFDEHRHHAGDAAEHEDFAAFVARQAGLALDITERRMKGSRYKVPKYVVNSLLSSPKFKQAVRNLSEKQGKTPEDFREETRSYLQEMVATPSTFFVDAYAAFNRFMLTQGYENEIVVDEKSLERMRHIVRNHPSMLLWTHKTYLDGCVVPKVMFDNDFPMPHMFGGVNMAFLGLGSFLRRSGAIFIRRSFQDNELYTLVLRHYIGYLMEKRFPMNWAFEGTRSRVGKLMPPRFGLLKYVLEAASETEAENIHIIPLSISYDMISDVDEYSLEQAGRVKSAESLSWFIGYIKGLRKPMGRIYLDIGEPVVLDKAPQPDDRLALSKVAFQVGVEVNKVTPLTLPSLVSMVLLGAAPRALTLDELLKDMHSLIDWARERNIRLSSDVSLSDEEAMARLADIMIENGVITRFDEGPEEIYGIAPDQERAASYYRNTVIHYFVDKAIIELALLKATEVESDQRLERFWEEAERLRDLFKFEFFYAPTEQFRDDLRAELQRVSADWESQLCDGGERYNELVESLRPLVAHATLLPFVEAYRIVADILVRMPRGEVLEEKACINQALKYGQQLYLQRRISSKASIGKLLFQNGFKLVSHMGLLEDGAEVDQKRHDLALEFRDIARRIAKVRSTAAMRWDQESFL